MGILVGLRVGDAVIDDDLTLFVSFNCPDSLASVWSLDRILLTVVDSVA